MTALPVISLHQPWASLIEIGVKTIETRSWRAPKSVIGRTIAIHAAKTQRSLDYLCWMEDHQGEAEPCLIPFADRITVTCGPGGQVKAFHDLPLGAIVATARLVASVPMVDSPAARNCLDMRVGHPEVGMSIRLDNPLPTDAEGHPIPTRLSEREERITDVTNQLAYGDFTPGRWAWMLEDVEPVNPPVPFVGGQGFSKKWQPE